MFQLLTRPVGLLRAVAERVIPSTGSPAGNLRVAWKQLRHLPGGKMLFSKMVGRMAPYTGTIGAQVLELREGYSRIEMADRPGIRNHLDSTHAVALVNLAEVTTGLAMMYSIPLDARGILSGLSIEYLKKGRGLLTGICHCPVPPTNQRREYDVVGEIYNEGGELVARATARWLIGPLREKKR